MIQTLKQAQTQAGTQAMTRIKAPPVGTLSTHTQIASPKVMLGSPKGQAAVQAAAFTAPAPNKKMRRRNLH